MQSASKVLMVEPAQFGFNSQTAESNSFQNVVSKDNLNIRELAIQEFQEAVHSLRAKGITVDVIPDSAAPVKPDAVFPNNWISMHQDGKIILYPMAAENRRLERRMDIVDKLKREFAVNDVLDFSGYEQKGKFLEGTGSIVFDHQNKFAYAVLSIRTDESLLQEVCDKIGYKPVLFHAVDEQSQAIYHTNVMMCIGKGIAVVCLDSIPVQSERLLVESLLKDTGHEILPISYKQMNAFAGNMLMLSGKNDGLYMVMSSSAYDALSKDELSVISRYAEPLPINIKTIETIGGGSARCMIAENFLPIR